MEFDHCFNSFTEDIKRNILIGRVDSVAFQSESHQYGFYTQNLFKVADDRNTSSTANGKRLLPECFGESFFGSLISRKGNGADITFATVHGGYFYFHIIGSDSIDVIDKQFGNLLMILMWNKTAGYFGVSF